MSPTHLVSDAIVLPAKPLVRFSKRLDRQLAQLERRIRKAVPQLARRREASERISPGR
jgi:hypothetical protein